MKRTSLAVVLLIVLGAALCAPQKQKEKEQPATESAFAGIIPNAQKALNQAYARTSFHLLFFSSKKKKKYNKKK